MTEDGVRDSAPLLRDDAVLLRPIAMEDVPAYVDRQDEEMADRFEWAGPTGIEEVREAVGRWVASWACDGSERNFAIVDPPTGEMIGDCELELRDDGFVNVMYVVFAGWRRRGMATRAVRLLAGYADRTFPGRPLLFRIHPDNEASIRVAETAGAVQAGSELSRTGRVLGRWVVEAAPGAGVSPPDTPAPR